MNQHDDALNLICGDPKMGPATFSRFVLPFGYSLIERNPPEDANKPYYKIIEPDAAMFAERRKYFTYETGRALFDRATWAVIQNWDNGWTKEQGITFYLPDKRTVNIKMAEPLVILFEFENMMRTNEKQAKAVASNDIEESVLRTGFLVVDLYFPAKQPGDHPRLDDLLHINDLFRFFDRPWKTHLSDHYKPCLKDVPVRYDSDDNQTTVGDLEDRTCYFQRWFNLLEKIPLLSGKDFYRFYPKEWETAANTLWSEDKNPYLSPDAGHLVYADERAYVWSAVILKNGGHSLSNFFETKSCQAHDHGHWIKFLNIDPPKSNPEKTHKYVRKFEQEWAKERTYHRWEESGTWYGFSYHSGVFIGPPLENPPLWQHFSTMYFDQTILLFYIRAVLFRFSQRLSILMDKRYHPERHNLGGWLEDLKTLRLIFTCFTIRYQFPLLSNQQQSIEMYEQARKYFDIDDLFAEIKQEIDNTYEFLEQEESRNTTKRANQLARNANTLVKLGIPIAIGALITSFFGMNVDNLFHLWECRWFFNSDCKINVDALIMLLITLGGIVAACIYVWRLKDDRNE